MYVTSVAIDTTVLHEYEVIQDASVVIGQFVLLTLLILFTQLPPYNGAIQFFACTYFLSANKYVVKVAIYIWYKYSATAMFMNPRAFTCRVKCFDSSWYVLGVVLQLVDALDHIGDLTDAAKPDIHFLQCLFENRRLQAILEVNLMSLKEF